MLEQDLNGWEQYLPRVGFQVGLTLYPGINHLGVGFKEKVFAWVMESEYVPLGIAEQQTQIAGGAPEVPSPSPIKQQRTAHYDTSSPPSSPIRRRATDERAALASGGAIRQKYLKLKEIFVINNDMGFPETAADFVIANLESLDNEWTLLIKEGIMFVRDRVRIDH